MGECAFNKCLRKRHYRSRDEATENARSLQARGDGDMRVEAFRCPVCGGWVVGRKGWGR